jgi:branched-chain amino acid transport system substrate-binding protein
VLFAWTKWINARGGLACHPVKFVSQDDASDPGQSQSAVQDEVQNQGAQALVAGFVPLSISGFRTGIDQAKVPIIGGDLFANDWWEDPLFYPVGTYVNANAYGSTKAVASGGATKVAVLYCIEAAICPPYNTAVQAGAAKGGYQVVYSAQVTITSTDYTSQCQSAKNAGAQQISMIVDGSAVDRLARSCASINYFPKFAIASLGATFDKNGPYIRQFTATIASAASKWYAVTVPAEQDFQDAMKTYAPSLKLDPTTIVAWADAMMLKTAVDNLGPSARTQPLTTALIRKGLSMVKNETLGGLVAPTTFDPGGAPNPKDQCYFPATFGANGQWAATTPTYQCQS